MKEQLTAVEWVLDWMSKNQYFIGNDLLKAVEEAKEMEKEREKSIFSIAYRMTPIEFGKEYCESEFEKFNKTFKQQEQ
jgi:hypothetical protein